MSEMIIKTVSDYHNIDPDTNKEIGGWMPTRHKGLDRIFAEAMGNLRKSDGITGGRK